MQRAVPPETDPLTVLAQPVLFPPLEELLGKVIWGGCVAIESTA
jgi:hypothetical protein